ncbi:uncharacterized protein LOC108033745 isoform X7 [Drosophila biarmipes]|uniref:uncharacterized protein LOC108033745 isoform X7 n=1 Tax=Drosophila biarmipes TaxID=125945 RepID=UPI0007E7A0B0|nr:uncharacterized protein LOC108033745 isoform X7 [Drosophila biarmipes]
MDDLENSIYDCPCEKNFCPETDVSVNRQQMMLSQPELWTHRKTEASLRVLTTVMLHTWRQRRKEVRELQEVVQRLQYSSMKYKNELHVYGTLMRVEQKRNRELQVQLKQSAMSIDQVRSSCELLASSVRNLTTEKIQLQSDLEQRSQEVKIPFFSVRPAGRDVWPDPEVAGHRPHRAVQSAKTADERAANQPAPAA